jgi:hypothetical protein
MPGFLGGSSGSGTGGEIRFPAEFIDPVTKLRVSEPQTLIDTDFEYGLQPTKWESVELINNTPSFFSKGGDTTIPNIASITTTDTSREIKVTTSLAHGLAVGIPINVSGTKSLTADGAYIINSVPDAFTFTYLCRQNQPESASIEDLYSSIVTGEFFQGSQIKIADSQGLVTDGLGPSSLLTVTTESPHGFGINTPFYFLNLNSTISQEFDSSNTNSKAFDAANLSTAQTFDGSNSLVSYALDLDNNAVLGGAVSAVSTVSLVNNTITVSHTSENFVGKPVGTPLYHNVSSASGHFSTTPRGVVFLKSLNTSTVNGSIFTVSLLPDGPVLPITSSVTGTFQLASEARTFAGNNVDSATQTSLTILKEDPIVFDGGNQGSAGAITTNGLSTVEGYTGTSSAFLISTTAGAGLDYYVGAMVKYESTGATAATGLTKNRTYFIASFATTATPNQYRITIKELPDSASVLTPTGGDGVQTFNKIGVAIDKDIVHVKNANFALKDMVEYSFPVGGRFTASSVGETKLFYFISKVYDAHNYELSEAVFLPVSATGGVVSDVSVRGVPHKVHTFATVGNTNFVVANSGTVEYLIVAGGGGGGFQVGGGGGAGGLLQGKAEVTAQTYTITVGGGGDGALPNNTRSTNGGNSSAFGLTAIGGGAGASHIATLPALSGGSGGGGSGNSNSQNAPGAAGTSNQGFGGGTGFAGSWSGGGGGGAREVGQSATSVLSGTGGKGGDGVSSIITGTRQYYAGGGGGSWNNQRTEASYSVGGAGGGARGLADNGDQYGVTAGENGAANTGGGGGGVRDFYNGSSLYSRAGNGGSGVVIVRYPTAPLIELVAPVATGGTITTVTADGYVYRVHAFTTVGTASFNVTQPGSFPNMEFLVVGGGGAGGHYVAGGGGGGGFTEGIFAASTQNYTITVGNGAPRQTSGNGGQGETSRIVGTNLSISAVGGGGGGVHDSQPGQPGASGGGAGSTNGQSVSGGAVTASPSSGSQIVTVATYGFRGGNTTGPRPNADCEGAGGGGAGGKAPDHLNTNTGPGGPGRPSSILGTTYYFAGGGGGGGYYPADAGDPWAGAGGIGGGGGGGAFVNGNAGAGGLFGLNAGSGGSTSGEGPGGNGGTNTGGGGGGGGHNGTGGAGGSGIVVIRYPIALA